MLKIQSPDSYTVRRFNAVKVLHGSHEGLWFSIHFHLEHRE